MRERNFNILQDLLPLKSSNVDRIDSSHRKQAKRTVESATLYTPVELLFGAERKNLFQKYLPNLPKGEMKHEVIRGKIAHDRKNNRKHGNTT